MTAVPSIKVAFDKSALQRFARAMNYASRALLRLGQATSPNSDLEYIRLVGRAERAEARLWLRQHVDETYEDLGLHRPTGSKK